jgi:hypothetical protein
MSLMCDPKHNKIKPTIFYNTHDKQRSPIVVSNYETSQTHRESQSLRVKLRELPEF